MARSREVKTPLATAAFTKGLFELQKFEGDDGGTKENWNVSLLFPKTTDISELKKVAGEAAIAEWGDKAGQMMADGLIHNPFLDGDGPQGKSKKDGKPHKGFAGTTFIRCSSGKDYPPQVFDRQKVPVMKVDGCPSGSQVYGVVSAYTWEHKKTNRRGVTFGISLVQVVKVATGDEILGGGGPDPDKYFDAIADEGDAPKETKTGKGAGGLFG